ncbi:MAG: selenocysteine-specific translation elongation factor, partial [Planctomycetes bacterium]|nr:selenocysteine-specific translation elongation factor [Planctomycetota bacterium]
IDHGKTSLLRALSSGDAADVDRLAEEQQRGLTIDVGYAELTLDDGVEVGVVDVPGHEKFVRNMVAGATGIDVVLFVVAADDGVMPQTREHLQIMSLLGLTTGVVALTKADLVDEEMLELVRSDVSDLVRGTFLEHAQLLAVSSTTGAGLPELRAEITRLVRAAPRRDAGGWFRMPILRTFTAQGFGTIVTGIPASGHVKLGDRVSVEPGGIAGRVRGLQVYHRAAEAASAGHRTAVNVADVDYSRVRRGDVLCEPGAFPAATLLDVRLHLLPTVPRALRHNQEVRLHVGTLECGARVLLVNRKQLGPGEDAWAQLKLDRATVTAPGDRFILRVPDLLATLGGGVVLGPGEHKTRQKGASREAEFEERDRGLRDVRVAVESLVRRAGLEGVERAAVARGVYRRPDETEPVLSALTSAERVVDLGRGLLIHADWAARGEASIVEAVTRFHEKSPLALGVKKALIPDQIGGSAAVVDGLLERLRARAVIESLNEGRVRLHGRGPRLNEGQIARRQAILDALALDPWQTPRTDEIATIVGGVRAEVDQLLALLDEEGRIILLAEGVVFLGESVNELKVRIAAHIEKTGGLSPADLKDLAGLTRKYSIPLLEHLDATGFTVRRGDKRVLK